MTYRKEKVNLAVPPKVITFRQQKKCDKQNDCDMHGKPRQAKRAGPEVVLHIDLGLLYLHLGNTAIRLASTAMINKEALRTLTGECSITPGSSIRMLR